jgi:dipeptidyl aminopeptidase/acylaminoacyl peptidase
MLAARGAPDGAGDAKPGDTQEKGASEPARDPKALPERLGDVQSLEFTEDDSALAVRTRDELFLFPLGRGTLALADAEWPTRDVEPALGGLQWSDDRTRYFSRGKALREIEPEPGSADTRARGAQFLDLATSRAVVLEGMREIAKLENARMSPGGDYVFAVEADRAKEPAPNLVPNYLTERVSTIEARRELADDAWPARKLWMWSTADGARRRIALPGEDGFVLQDIGWAPKGEPRFALRRLSSDYRTLETWIWSEGGPVLALVDRDEHWVGGPAGQARWSRDGARLYFGSECTASSTTPGRNQVFALDPRTGAVAQLTAVEGEVSSWVELDDGSLAIVASRDDPARREIARVLPGPPPRTRWLDVRAGANEGLVAAPGGSVALFLHQELGLPGEIHVAPLDRSTRPHALTRTIPNDYLAHDWIRPVRIAATHADGTRIPAHVTLPRETSLEDPDRPRPCVVFIHGAGYLQNVTDSMSEYAVNQMFHSRLATLGYVVADVDYRGSAGYGAKFRGEVQFQLGKLELEDIAAVLDRLAEDGVIDRGRVACYGGSYGGFLTLMALFTEPDRWVAGAALRSVTDWRTYHPGYTQPRLGRPSTNPEAYARSSPIDHAQNLKAPLLLLHGMTDTNVFAQDSIRLIEKLIDLGLDFDAMLYPSQGHGFTDGMHWLDEYRRIERFLVKHLGEP